MIKWQLIDTTDEGLWWFILCQCGFEGKYLEDYTNFGKKGRNWCTNCGRELN